MKYLSYISQDKVDQLLSQIEENEILEWSEKISTNKEKKGSMGLAKVFSFLGADANISYGRADYFLKESKLRKNYVQKLILLLSSLSDSILDYEDNKLNLVQGKFYSCCKEFQVTEKDIEYNITTLTSTDKNENLELHCSTKYFSCNSDFSKGTEINSTNYAFFKKRMPLQFSLVFLFLSHNNEKALGTPLFLSLTAQQGLNL